MTFPTGTTIDTTNLSTADGDPSLARADLYDLAVAVNSIISSYNQASGVLVLDGSGLVQSSKMPATIAPSGNLTLNPVGRIVQLNNVLRLAQINRDDLGTATGTASPTAGDLCYLTNGDAGNPCLACYDGSNWRVVRFGMTVNNALATLTASSTLTVEADA